MTEKGFTLIEMAIVLVIIGLIIGGVVKSTTMIDNARAKNVLTQATALIDSQHSYYDRNKRYAGDLNNDGQIDYTSYTAASLDGTAESANDADYAFKELKDMGLIRSDMSNASIAATANGGQMHFSGAQITDASNNKTPVNMVIITSETCMAAFQIEMALDGTQPDGTNSASTGSVRQIIDGALVATGSWTSTGTPCVSGNAVNSSAATSIAIFF
ncbi:MAG: prepilin-type N-terminal cleavage/methylation domain-containing protein [Deferribacterales bacterium]